MGYWILFVGIFILSVFPKNRWWRIGLLTFGCFPLSLAIEQATSVMALGALAVVVSVGLYFVSTYLHRGFANRDD